MKNIEYIPLPDVLSFVVDNRGKTVPTDPNGEHVLIATNCILNSSLFPRYENVRTLSHETYTNWFRSHPEPGDIIFVNKGSNNGKVCMVPDPVDFCIAQDMVALRTNNKIIYNKFLFAYLRSYKVQRQVRDTSIGDAIPHFKKSLFKEIKVPIPNMDVQKKIGDFYYLLCKKVENNEKINRNLSDQIDSWFYKLYLDETSQRVTFGDVVKRCTEKVKGDRVSVLSPVSTGEIVLSEEFFTKQVYSKDISKYLKVEQYAFCYNPARVNIGSIGMNDFSFTGCVSPVYVAFKTTDQLRFYMSRYFKTDNFKAEVIMRSSGSVRQSLRYEDLIQIEFRKPSEESLSEFNDFYSLIKKQIRHLKEENKRLVDLRDLVLPKLISGELDVSDLDI